MSRFPMSPDPDPSRGEVPPPPLEVTHRAEDGAASPSEDGGGFPRWLGAAVAVLVIGGGAAGYFALHRATPEPTGDPLASAKASSAQPSARSAGLPRAESAGAVPSLATSATNAAAAAGSADGKPAPEPKPELLTKVSQLTIAAVIPGPRGRAMIDGRMHEIGDEISPGLVLREVDDGQLVFVDETGAIYSRRF